jgi:3-hydroxybutyryl-CoA dehydrogenase
MTAPGADDLVRDAAAAILARSGAKVTLIKDSPGFIAQRMCAMIANLGCEMAMIGIASAQDVDTAMTLGAGWPLGPCALLDLVGIDVHVHASEALYEKLREPRMAPPPRLVVMRNAGLLGRKSGRGFYSYER